MAIAILFFFHKHYYNVIPLQYVKYIFYHIRVFIFEPFSPTIVKIYLESNNITLYSDSVGIHGQKRKINTFRSKMNYYY